MQVNRTQFRIAALVAWFDLTEDSDLQNRIKNELWCLRNDVGTAALSDITVSEYSTHDILDHVFETSSRSREEQAAFILCTLHEIS